MSSTLTLAARLQLEAQQWEQGLTKSRASTRGFVAGVKREFTELRSFMQSTAGRLATIGGAFSAGNELRRSAQFDKALTQVGQTAGATRVQIAALRGELHGMAGETGEALDSIREGFDVLIASGMQWSEAQATITGVNKAMAVTGARAETLAGTLGVASTAFDFDLSKPGQALQLLDKMTVAGRLGNAELQDLGSIFSRVGMNARGAGFGFEQTLAFIEGLSMIERQPERLATLADSTLRLFTNAKYMRDAQKATGIRFFSTDGARRDPLAVLADMKKIMDGMKTDAQREGFLSKAFGNADLDTIKGLRALLAGDSLSKIGRFTGDIRAATGTIERDLPAAINNAVSASGRLKARLVEAADGFAKPINNAFTRLTDWALRSKKDGGLDLSGGELALGGAVSLAALYAGGRGMKGVLGRLSGGAASLGTGVAMGQALLKADAATPVFVVGAAPGVFGVGGGLGGGIPPVVPGAGMPAGKAPTTMAGLARRRLAGMAGTAASWLSVGALPMSMALDERNYKLDQSPGFQRAMNMPKREWWLTRGGNPSLNFLQDLIGGFKTGSAGRDGALDLNIHVKDDRVSVSVANSTGVGNVSTRTGPSTRYRPRTGRMMGSGD